MLNNLRDGTIYIISSANSFQNVPCSVLRLGALSTLVVERLRQTRESFRAGNQKMDELLLQPES